MTSQRVAVGSAGDRSRAVFATSVLTDSLSALAGRRVPSLRTAAHLIPPAPIIAKVLTEDPACTPHQRAASADPLDGHRAGDQSPSGSVVCPTSIR